MTVYFIGFKRSRLAAKIILDIRKPTTGVTEPDFKKKAKGSLQLAPHVVVDKADEAKFYGKNAIRITGAEKGDYIVFCKDEDDMLDWLAALEHVIQATKRSVNVSVTKF
jgi:hypothetical protein